MSGAPDASIKLSRYQYLIVNSWSTPSNGFELRAPSKNQWSLYYTHTHTYGMTGNFLPYWFRRVDKLRITLRGRGNFAITILTRCSVQTCARVPTLNEWKSTSLLLSFTPVVRHSRGLRFDDRLKLRHRDLSWCRCPFPASSFFPGIERRVNFV